jgi:hypothetical protein
MEQPAGIEQERGVCPINRRSHAGRSGLAVPYCHSPPLSEEPDKSASRPVGPLSQIVSPSSLSGGQQPPFGRLLLLFSFPLLLVDGAPPPRAAAYRVNPTGACRSGVPAPKFWTWPNFSCSKCKTTGLAPTAAASRRVGYPQGFSDAASSMEAGPASCGAVSRRPAAQMRVHMQLGYRPCERAARIQ